MFDLHPQLANDTFTLGSFLLSRVLLMNNACFPWIILVPEREFIGDLTDISISGRMLLMEESTSIMSILRKIYMPDKINMAALGNIVPQFHMHIVARFKTDPAWPDPVWGNGKPSIPYSPAEQRHASAALLAELILLPNFTAAHIHT